MADNTCGGSTPLKSLGAQADRDRSLHQDRRITPGTSAASTAFRTAAPNSQTEGDFNAFLQNGSPLTSPNGIAPAMRPGGQPITAPTSAHAQVGYPAGPQIGLTSLPPPPSFGTPHVGYPAGAVTLSGPNGNSWVNEFGALNLGPGRDMGHPSVHPSTNMGFLPPSNGYMPFHPSAQPYTSPAHFAPPYMQPNPMATFNPYAPQSGLSAPANGTWSQSTGASAQPTTAPQPMLSEAELNAQFDTFDKHEKLESEAEFKSHMNYWMAKHGPTPKSPMSIYNAKPKRPEDANAELEYFAKELEEMGPYYVAPEDALTIEGRLRKQNNANNPWKRKPFEVSVAEQMIAREKELGEKQKQREKKAQDRAKNGEATVPSKEQDDLSRTASEILQSVSSTENEKFRKSSFFQLMQRISSKEVILEDDDLVYSATGQPISKRDTALDHREDLVLDDCLFKPTLKAKSKALQTGAPVDVAEGSKKPATTEPNQPSH